MSVQPKTATQLISEYSSEHSQKGDIFQEVSAKALLHGVKLLQQEMGEGRELTNLEISRLLWEIIGQGYELQNRFLQNGIPIAPPTPHQHT